MGILDRFTKKTVLSDSEGSRAIPFNINCWNYRRFEGEMLDIDVIVACIDALARNLAKMELTAVRRKQDQIAITDYTSDVARVLKRPNPYMTQYDFIYKTAALYYASNNAFIWPEYDDEGNLIALWPVNYRHVKTFVKDGVDVVKFELKKNHWFTVPYSQIIPLRNHYFEDDIFGDSNHAFNPVAELMNAQNQGIIEGIKNSAIIRGLLKATQVMKEDDIKKARERFISENLHASNNGGVMMLDSKFDYKQLDSKPYVIDADTRKQTKDAAFDYFGVNEAFLQNDFTSEKYEAVYEGKLEPFAIMFTQALTVGIYTERMRGFGDQIEANMARLKYQPLTQVTSMIAATKELGLFTRDEYREMLGYEPLGPERGGDELMIATNNYESSTVTEGDSSNGNS
jgi:HK97 family phage portal protein